MSKKVTISGLVHEVDYGHGEKEYRLYSADMSSKYSAVIGPAEFTYEVPDSFDPRPAKIAALERERQKVRAEFAAKITEIEDQISRLLCIEMAEA